MTYEKMSTFVQKSYLHEPLNPVENDVLFPGGDRDWGIFFSCQPGMGQGLIGSFGITGRFISSFSGFFHLLLGFLSLLLALIVRKLQSLRQRRPH